jgi:hypothetical protein
MVIKTTKKQDLLTRKKRKKLIAKKTKIKYQTDVLQRKKGGYD